MATTYLGIGSNLGNKQEQLITATVKLAERAGEITALSGFYETKPWGYESPHLFLNAVVRLETALSPFELLARTQQIEREGGRIRKTDGARYRDRTMDLDLLLYDDLIIESATLTLPHPHLHRRLFVLLPLTEIAPLLRHPVFNRTVEELLAAAASDVFPAAESLVMV